MSASSFRRLAGGLMAMMIASTAVGQLRITEVMFDPVSDGDWEWFEVQNTGNAAVNLDGYIVDDIGSPRSSMDPSIDATLSANTSIPAGGVAVFYDGSALDFDESRFRNTWQLGASVPLIGVDSAPSYNNGGDAIGVWANQAAYDADVAGGGGSLMPPFSNATVSIDYSTGYPGGNNASSIYWTGNGDINDPAEWASSVDGTDSAVTSIMTTLPSAPINSASDIANPGVLPGGTAPAGLLVTEIMYNPASSESNWEFIEILNNTGAAIDFAANPYFLDDSAGTLSSANITEGMIADGEVAIIYNDNLDLADISDAWGNSNNYIPAGWQALNNSGDSISLWDNQADYDTDRAAMSTANAETSVAYEVGANGWPAADGNGSIFLSNLANDSNTGSSWVLSADGDSISVNASEVIRDIPDNPGGDIGSPGFAPGGGTNPVGGDFDGNGVYECADVDSLVAEIVAGTNDPNFDLTGDSAVDVADLTAWRAEAGDIGGLTASGNPIQEGDANLDGTVDGLDFIRWNNNKFTSTPAFCSGDFNADGIVDGIDFIRWNNEKFTSADAVSVPEPASGLALLLGAAGMLSLRSRNR